MQLNIEMFKEIKNHNKYKQMILTYKMIDYQNK